MKSVSHSEARWAMLRAHVIRCNGHMVNGGRCKREAEDGAVVCDQHGGAAPKSRRRAAERLIMSADHVSQKLLEWLDDPEVPYRVRAEIAQDVLDRAGLIATQVHQIIPTTEDPIMRFFKEAFSDPNNWEENPPQPAIEERVIDRPTRRAGGDRPHRSRIWSTHSFFGKINPVRCPNRALATRFSARPLRIPLSDRGLLLDDHMSALSVLKASQARIMTPISSRTTDATKATETKKPRRPWRTE